MPLIKTIAPDEKTQILVWKVTESIEELKETFLKKESLKRFNNMRSEIHQKGFLSIRHLLKEIGYSDADLHYSDNGKPHLKNDKHVSISHSFDYATIIVSDTFVGIDIEKNRPKIKSIASKFLNTEEAFLQEEKLVEQLTVIWGAKEALYKIKPNSGLLFKKHLFIAPFNLKNNCTLAWIKKEPINECYCIYYEQIEGYALVYALPKP